MLDFVEVVGSVGNSSILMESRGHRIFFEVDNQPGFIEIKRAGWSGFAYACIINDIKLNEATEVITESQELQYSIKMFEATLTPDEGTDQAVTWYNIRTTRLKDNVMTTVHRRFRDFSELNSQVKQNLKGNHLLSILPPLPEKPLKLLTDHNDPQFIQDRQSKLEIYLNSLVAIPHVSEMVCVKAFVGLMEQVREFSLVFKVMMLGLSLNSSDKNPETTPAVVGSVQRADICQGVQAGDSISKVNGVPVAGMTFSGVVNRIKLLPRPIIIHFIQVIGGISSDTSSNQTNKTNAITTDLLQPTPSEEITPKITTSLLPEFEDFLTNDSPVLEPGSANHTNPLAPKNWSVFDEEPLGAMNSTPAMVPTNTTTTSSSSSSVPNTTTNNTKVNDLLDLLLEPTSSSTTSMFPNSPMINNKPMASQQPTLIQPEVSSQPTKNAIDSAFDDLFITPKPAPVVNQTPMTATSNSTPLAPTPLVKTTSTSSTFVPPPAMKPATQGIPAPVNASQTNSTSAFSDLSFNAMQSANSRPLPPPSANVFLPPPAPIAVTPLAPLAPLAPPQTNSTSQFPGSTGYPTNNNNTSTTSTIIGWD